MNVLIASDKFKGSLSQEQVNSILAEVISEVKPEANIRITALSDGGDGFLNTVGGTLSNAELRTLKVSDPLFRKREAAFLFDLATSRAYIEFARASGMELLNEEQRNPFETSSVGVGQMIERAVHIGAKEIYVGLGGSATNDGGMGIAHAVGFRFMDKDGIALKPCGKNLEKVVEIIPPSLNPISKVKIFAVNDVNNPLYGVHGAAYVYAGQKGANASEIKVLDHGLRHFAEQVSKMTGYDYAGLPGSGAAGGAAFGLKSFLEAQYIKGIDFMLKITGLRPLLVDRYFDLVITGEGSIDDQTLSGKLVAGLGRLAADSGIPVIAFCGVSSLTRVPPSAMGLKTVVSISNPEKDLDYNLKHAEVLLREKAYAFFSTYNFKN
ncbi:glycerate kinase [Robertkochia marina]|nr:glycerate kinase [Robertkochia marina]